jgi:hypothetical protein
MKAKGWIIVARGIPSPSEEAGLHRHRDGLEKSATDDGGAVAHPPGARPRSRPSSSRFFPFAGPVPSVGEWPRATGQA